MGQRNQTKWSVAEEKKLTEKENSLMIGHLKSNKEKKTNFPRVRDNGPV